MSSSKSYLSETAGFGKKSAAALKKEEVGPHPANDLRRTEKGAGNLQPVMPPLPATGAPVAMMAPSPLKNKLLTRKRKRSRHPLREKRIRAGFTLEELAELTALSPSYLSRLESGSRRLNADVLQKLALVLSCHPGDLLPHSSHSNKFTHWNQPAAAPEGPVAINYPQDLPFYEIKESADHGLHFGDATEWVTRPPELMEAPGAFAFSVRGESVSPWLSGKDRIFAHPTRPLSTACSVLVVTHDNQVVLGEFIEWTSQHENQPDTLHVKTYRQAANNNFEAHTISIPHKDIRGTYRVVGSVEI